MIQNITTIIAQARRRRLTILSSSTRDNCRWLESERAGILLLVSPRGAAGLLTQTGGMYRGPMLFRLGLPECLIILVVLLIVAGLAYRGGYFRARRRK